MQILQILIEKEVIENHDCLLKEELILAKKL